MTQLLIDVVDISGGTHPDDKVRLWAPQHRPDGERVVSTSPVDVKLVDGQATVEVLPGPARVQIMTQGVVDSAPKRVTIPDEASVTLRAVIEDGLEWEPEVISRVAALASRAESAADRAETVADTFGSLEGVATSVQAAEDAAVRAEAGAATATGHATQTADDRRQTGEDRTQTGLDRQAAEQSADEASTHEDNSLDAAAAAIAAAVSVAQFQGHGFPNGQVAAPVGSIYTDLDATNGAIRWIKTSGTGNTGWDVEYGDTGWRNVSALLGSGVSGNAFVNRIGETVNFMLHNILTSTAGHITLFSLPAGFRPATISGANWRNGSVLSDNGDTVRPVSYFDGNFRVLNMPTGKAFGGSVSLVAEDGWPSILPGTPA